MSRLNGSIRYGTSPIIANMAQFKGILFDNDGTLQYSKNDEIIGFNHPNGKRGLSAHVAFADGHVEKLSIPAAPSGSGWTVKLGLNDLKDLTKWLCEGKDVTFNGKRYEVMEN